MAKKSKQKSKSTYRFNRNVDSLFLHSSWAINEVWGLRKLAEYTNQVDQISSSDGMGTLIMEQIKSKKESQKPKYFSKSDNGFILGDNESAKAGSIALLSLKGVMRMDDSLSHSGVSSLCKEIQACNSNPNVDAIVLEIDSGGGLSLAGQMLKNAVKDSHIPIVSYGHFVASAAVHGSAPSDHIMLAGNSTEMGSIGSMVTLNKNVIEWYKENYQDIYAKVSPNKNYEWRELLKGNTKPLVESVTNNAISFQNEMKKFRNLNPSMEKETLEGGMFQADNAIERGLADSKGTLNDAISMAHNLANNNKSKNSNTMNYKASWIALVATLNAIFGAKFDNSETANPETVNGAMDLKTVLENIKQSVITETNKSMNTLLEGLKKSNEDLKAEVEDLKKNQSTTDEDLKGKVEDLEKKHDALEVKYDGLTEQNVKLTKEKKEIETKLAEIQGNTHAGAGGESGNALDKESSAGKFNAQLNKLQEIEGESKY